MTAEDVQYWTMIGTWVAGVATAVATGVALWLATRDSKEKLAVRLDATVTSETGLATGDGADKQVELLVHLHGLGAMPCAIRSVTLSGKRINLRPYTITLRRFARNGTPDIVMRFGEQRVLRVKVDEKLVWAELPTYFSGSPTVTVETTLGRRFTAKFPGGTWQHLVSEIKDAHQRRVQEKERGASPQQEMIRALEARGQKTGCSAV